jgi:hypothetical protein
MLSFQEAEDAAEQKNIDGAIVDESQIADHA